MKTINKIFTFVIIATMLVSSLCTVAYAANYPAAGFDFLDVVAFSQCTLTRGAVSGTYKNGYVAVSVDFGTGNVYDSVTINTGVDQSNAGGTIYVRLDSPVGDNIAALKVQKTPGTWTDRQPQTAIIEKGEINGVHTVYFVFSKTGVGDMSYVKFNGGVERTVPMDITDESDTELFNKLTALKLLKHDVKTNFRPQKFVTNNDMIDMLLTDQYLFMKDDILSKFELDGTAYATYKDVSCAALSLLGYGDYLKYIKGGTFNNANGYYTYAEKWNLFDGIDDVTPDRRIKKSEILTVINNVLNFTLDKISYISNNTVYRAGKTDGKSVYRDYKRLEGVVTQNQYTSLDGSDLKNSGKIAINSKVYDTQLDNVDEYIGYNVEFYTNNDDEVCYIQKYNNSILNISSYDIESALNGRLKYTDAKTERKKSVVISNDINVVYNGQLVTDYNIGIFKPNDGGVTFIDSDDDGTYNTAVINDIKAFVVDTVSDSVIYFKNSLESINLDAANTKYIIKRSGGNEADKEFLTTSLKEWSVLTVGKSISYDGSVMYILQVCSDKASGVVQSVNKDDILTVRVDNQDVAISKTAYYSDGTDEIKLGEEITAYKNKWGRAIVVRKNSQSSYRYGYIADMSLKSDGPFDNSLKLKILNDEGDLEVVKVRDNVTIDGVVYKTTKSALAALNGNGSRTNTFSRYKTNKNGEVSDIDLPYDYTEDTPNGLGTYETLETLHMTAAGNLRFKTSSKSFGGFAMVTADTTVFSVPVDESGNVDISETDSFGVGKKTYINDNNYNIEAYSVTTDSFVSDIIVEKVKPVNVGVDSINSSIDLSLVESLDEVYDSQSNEIKKRLCYWKRGEKGSAYLTNRCSQAISINDYHKGDAVRFSTNAAGEIDNILKVYDMKSNAITGTNSTEYNAENRYATGKVSEKKGDYVRLDSSKEIFNLNGTAVYIYHKNRNIITSGTTADIVSAAASNNAENVLMWIRYTDTRLVLIFKD